MTKKLLGQQSRHHIYLFDEDWDYLMRVYGPSSRSKIPVSEAIRVMIHASVVKLRARADVRIDENERVAEEDVA